MSLFLWRGGINELVEFCVSQFLGLRPSFATTLLRSFCSDQGQLEQSADGFRTGRPVRLLLTPLVNSTFEAGLKPKPHRIADPRRGATSASFFSVIDY